MHDKDYREEVLSNYRISLIAQKDDILLNFV